MKEKKQYQSIKQIFNNFPERVVIKEKKENWTIYANKQYEQLKDELKHEDINDSDSTSCIIEWIEKSHSAKLSREKII